MNILLSGKSAWQYHHANHHHKTWELIANTAGTGYMEINGQTIPFSPYTVVCIPPQVEHNKHSEEGFRDMWVWFDDFPMMDADRVTILQDDSDHNITSLINVLYSVQYRKEPNKKVVAESLLESIQQLILSRLERKPLDARVDAILNDIVHHFQDPSFSLDECLTRNGYCSDHMRRLFREQTGKTPHEYLSGLRIKTAKKLLASRDASNYSVSEIGTMVGFNDVSYFSRIFKKATGVAPGAYVEKQ
ncbi:MAG: helix-turn-helix transcriptional regulator [Clostridia bacterium]|nr:helix-turn-helix transcriptional regulator [Clostridia bacterium]MBQ9774361.1 helix-turn-helix transcriptional regulator [Clostridia bacterium]